MDMKNTWGPPTTVVIVFGTDMTTKTVLFNGVEIPVENSQDTNLIFRVPSIANGTYGVNVGGESVGSFEVRYPDTVPTVSVISKSEISNWYSLLGSGFYAGNTTMLIDGIEYDPYVMTPDECAVILPSEPTSFVLTTPIGSTTYNK
jgi:hypothetical protein